MFIEAILASVAVATCSLVGVFFFGNNKRLDGAEKYIIPGAVGVFLSLVLFELIPETLHANEVWGGIAISLGFIFFYVLSYELHRYFHRSHNEQNSADCDRKAAATLLLIGDGIHNIADGVILGAAFLINPAVGTATAIGLALHEIPQEIVEFGVLVRGGYSRFGAAWRNLISASTIILGTALTLILAEISEEYIWIITGVAAGNLLYLAATDLLPRVHGTLKNYGSFWLTVASIVIGFTVMTSVLIYVHEHFGHGHDHNDHSEDEEEIHNMEEDLTEEELHEHYHEHGIAH